MRSSRTGGIVDVRVVATAVASVFAFAVAVVWPLTLGPFSGLPLLSERDHVQADTVTESDIEWIRIDRIGIDRIDIDIIDRIFSIDVLCRLVKYLVSCGTVVVYIVLLVNIG